MTIKYKTVKLGNPAKPAELKKDTPKPAPGV